MKILIIICLTLIVSCKSQNYCDINKIKHTKWIYESGYHIGDIIDFNFQHRLEKDCSIIINGYKVAQLKSITSKELKIISKSDEIGTYIKF